MVSGIRIGARFASLCLLGAFAACGSDPQFQAIDNGTSPDDTPLRGGNNGTGSTTGNGGRGNNGNGGSVVTVGGTSQCEPKSCDDLGMDCGTVADGCGDIIDCGECDADSKCGIVETNVCTPLDSLCTPIPEDEACEGKECGAEGDGCGHTYQCGECDDGETCGAEEPFQCAVGSGPGDCVPIASCADAGKRCGVIGDGCGGTIDCTAELGDCPEETFCGIDEPYQCAAPPECESDVTSCGDSDWECGMFVDECGNVFDCADVGRSCGPFELCKGGVNGATECQNAVPDCELCGNVPACPTNGPTRISGRVVTPGRNDANVENQVGVPNAFVYILRNDDPAQLPAITTGIGGGATGTACERCEDQDLGPVLAGAVTDASGAFTISGNIPVGVQFVLVVKVGKFRRAIRLTIPEADACKTTALPTTVSAGNPTRLPRTMSDGLAVNIPRVAVSTGEIDAIECVLFKMGIAQAEFGNPGNGTAAPRVHLYRGGNNNTAAGARVDADTPRESTLYGSADRLRAYDMVIADCEGASYSSDPDNAQQGNVRDFVNRGGRLFASHLSFTWLADNNTGNNTVYPAGQADFTTGLRPSATWNGSADSSTNTGNGIISIGRPHVSPRIENFRDWMVTEGVTTANTTPAFSFNLNEPRSQVANGAGDQIQAGTEEFVHTTTPNRTQQFSFNTPYGAPEMAACGRVAYSGFHVSYGGGSSPYAGSTFPGHCYDPNNASVSNNGNLTNQEKVLLYMLFDLGACVGDDPETPSCTPAECPNDVCGIIPNGCGGTLNCGPCTPMCKPTTCAAQNAECGSIGDGCEAVLDCGPCPPGQTCGAQSPNQCGDGPDCEPRSCEDADAECGLVGDGCSDVIDCGECPPGQICGLEEPYKCGTPECQPTTCDAERAQCGDISDNCGDVLDCGECPANKQCVNHRCMSIQ
jgi:hypothetical protein